MPSAAKIIKTLENPSALDLALVIPAASTGLQTLEDGYAVVNAYSSEQAKDIPLGADAGFWRKIALGFLPLFLAFGWVAFFMSVRQLVAQPERNRELWLSALVNFVAAAGATLVTIFLFTGLSYLAPYIVIAVLGLNALQGLYHTVKQLYLAYKKPEQRWRHLTAAGHHVLGIVINTLAIVLNVFIFQTAKLVAAGIRDFASDILSIFLHYQELMDLIHGPVMAGVSVIKAVGLGWMTALSLWFLMSASKLNHQSYRLLAGRQTSRLVYEKVALNDIRYFINQISKYGQHPLKRFFWALTATVALPLYGLTGLIHFVVLRPAAFLLVGIPEILLRGLYLCVKRCCGLQKPAGELLNQKPLLAKCELTGEVASSMDKLPEVRPSSPKATTVARGQQRASLSYSPKHSHFKPTLDHPLKKKELLLKPHLILNNLNSAS